MSKPFYEKINLLLFVQYESEHIMEINRAPFVPSLVILWLLPGICHPSRDILSSKFIRADGVEISEIYHLNNTFYSKSYLYRTRYNQNTAFEHSD